MVPNRLPSFHGCGGGLDRQRFGAGKPQHDSGAGMVGIAPNGCIELGRHRGDDALPHAGGARIALGIEADAVVGDRQQQIRSRRVEADMDRAGAVGIAVGVLVRVIALMSASFG